MIPYFGGDLMTRRTKFRIIQLNDLCKVGTHDLSNALNQGELVVFEAPSAQNFMQANVLLDRLMNRPYAGRYIDAIDAIAAGTGDPLADLAPAFSVVQTGVLFEAREFVTTVCSMAQDVHHLVATCLHQVYVANDVTAAEASLIAFMSLSAPPECREQYLPAGVWLYESDFDAIDDAHLTKAVDRLYRTTDLAMDIVDAFIERLQPKPLKHL